MAFISEMHELYLQCHTEQFAGNTVAIKKRAIRYFLGMVGDMDIHELSYRHAEEYKIRLLDPAYCDRAGRKKPGKASANDYMTNLWAFFAWLVKRGDLRRNPFFGLPRYKEEKKPVKVFTAKEVELLLKRSGERYRLPVICGAIFGLRLGEALNLTKHDIDLKDLTVEVRSKSGSRRTWPWSTKTSYQRLVPIPAIVVFPDFRVPVSQWLRSRIATCKHPYLCLSDRQYYSMLKMQNTGMNANGRTLAKHELQIEANRPWRGFGHGWIELWYRVGLPQRDYKSFKTLRATFGTILSRQMPIDDVQVLMGHSTPKTTRTFYIAREEQQIRDRAREELENYYVS